MLLQVNSTNFPSKSLLTLLSALDSEIWREREQKSKTHLAYLKLKDVAEF